jgi:Ca-activated chloride channel family protein
MLPPFFVLFGFLLTQKESQEHFFSKEVINKLRVNRNTLTLKFRNALFMFMGFFIIIALAQPVIKDGTVEIKAKSADIMIALDISDSMLATDVYPNRLEMAKQKALTLLDEAPNERVGVVAFAKNSYLVSPLSFDTEAVAFLLRQLDTSSITEKGTDLLSVLDVVSRTQKDQEKKYLLILSDGGDKSDFNQEIKMAKESGITVFVLSVATKKGAPIKLKDGTFIKYNGDIIVSKLNENIAKLATSTGGVYIQGTAASDDIKTMLREITNISEEKEFHSEEIQKYIPLFYYPVGMAIFILLIATSSINRKNSSNMASVFIFFCLLFINPHAEAGVLDFMELNKAKEAYNNGEFEKSAEVYNKYAQDNLNAESYYNAGNSFYKQKKYKKAIESYKKATIENKELRAKNYSNLGNAYVKEAGKDSLQKAVESYEESLKIKEDKEIRENLNAVKNFLEKQKKESKDSKKNSDDKKDKNKKDSDNKEKSEDKKDSEDKESKNEDKKEKSSDEKDNSENKEPKDEEKNSDDIKNKNEKDKKKKVKDDKKEKLQKLDKDKKENSSTQEINEQKMSDAEEQKWLKQLNTKSNTYLYQLSDKKPKSNNIDEKPW